MKYFRAGIVFTPDPTDSHLEARPYIKFGKPKKRFTGGQTDPTPRGERIRNRLVGTTERTVAKVIERSGNRFVVKDRDGHPRGWYPTVGEAERKAIDSDFIFDRVEGRNLNRKKRNYDIPDPGVVEDQWTVGS